MVKLSSRPCSTELGRGGVEPTFEQLDQVAGLPQRQLLRRGHAEFAFKLAGQADLRFGGDSMDRPDLGIRGRSPRRLTVAVVRRWATAMGCRAVDGDRCARLRRRSVQRVGGEFAFDLVATHAERFPDS